MKLCFMCDLHLPFDKNALQYDVLNWVISNIEENKPQGIVFAGDVTCDGNEKVYDEFIAKISSLEIPFFYIPGNSDLRLKTSKESIKNKASNFENLLGGTKIFALNDCEASISNEQYKAMEKADKNSVVFMHHPVKYYGKKMQDWCDSHKETTLFYGHLHYFEKDKNTVSLPALDPDKSIGEPPCLVYFDTKTKEITKSHYSAFVPEDFKDYFGISCYNTIKQIEFAAKNKLKFVEIRPNILDVDENELLKTVEIWRNSGGEQLSLHLPDVWWDNAKKTVSGQNEAYVELIKKLKVNRVTQHVPQISVKSAREEEDALDKICDYVAKSLESVPFEITVGVENMHMTAKETADENRRFGYLPEECLEFMELLSKKTKHKVGINFDIGHARNNAPYSQKYQISTWLSLVGKHIVGYHIHQVQLLPDGSFKNHAAITDVYGCLISYASLFKCWDIGQINKSPLIFEMSSENAYEITLNCFKKAD